MVRVRVWVRVRVRVRVMGRTLTLTHLSEYIGVATNSILGKKQTCSDR